MTADILAIQAAAYAALDKHNKAQEKLKERTVVPALPNIPAAAPVPLITIPAGLSVPPVIKFPGIPEV